MLFYYQTSRAKNIPPKTKCENGTKFVNIITIHRISCMKHMHHLCITFDKGECRRAHTINPKRSANETYPKVISCINALSELVKQCSVCEFKRIVIVSSQDDSRRFAIVMDAPPNYNNFIAPARYVDVGKNSV